MQHLAGNIPIEWTHLRKLPHLQSEIEYLLQNDIIFSPAQVIGVPRAYCCLNLMAFISFVLASTTDRISKMGLYISHQKDYTCNQNEVMPFGMKNAPANFQSLVMVMEGWRDVVVILMISLYAVIPGNNTYC